MDDFLEATVLYPNNPKTLVTVCLWEARWFMPASAIGPPLAAFSAACPPEGQVPHLLLCGSKEKHVHTLSLRLCSM